MRTYLLAVALATAALVMLAGCSTPKEAMEQANHTVQLMSLMEQPIGEYRRTWAALEQSRLLTLKQQSAMLADSILLAERSALAQTAAGDTGALALSNKLVANAEAIQAAKVRNAEQSAVYDKKIAGLLQPLPNTAATVTAAQVAVGKMGSELPFKQRAEELLDFAQEVKVGIDASKKAKEDAKAKEASAAQVAASAAATSK